MRVCPESVTHLVVKLFNVKSKFDYIDKNQRLQTTSLRSESNDAGHLQVFCRSQVTEKLLRTSGLVNILSDSSAVGALSSPGLPTRYESKENKMFCKLCQDIGAENVLKYRMVYHYL